MDGPMARMQTEEPIESGYDLLDEGLAGAGGDR